jgi:Tc5 transposase DNA-binding domain
MTLLLSTTMGRADSNTLKARKAGKADAQRLRLALEIYTAEQLKPKIERRSLRDVANEFHVDHTTLSRHYKGGVSMSAFNSLKQKLTVAEEKTLVDFALGCADRGLPVTHAQLAGYANQLLEKRIGPDYVPVGQNWSDRFVERHHETMQTHWSRPLDSQRARALNPEVVKHWFALVQEHIIGPDIKPHNVYGMDESGFPPSNQGRQKVIGRRGTKTQHKQGGADRENVTAIVTICADGTVLDPTVIFKGKNIMAKWGENNVASAS